MAEEPGSLRVKDEMRIDPMIDNSCSAVALDYRKRDFSVIPIAPMGKKPLISWAEYQSRLANQDEIKEWWSRWPDANVGIVTGAISKLLVIDLDSGEAKDSLKEILGDYDLSAVPRSRTGNG